jgi:hypothetical protein
MDKMVTPLPRPEMIPPVTTMYFILFGIFPAIDVFDVIIDQFRPSSSFVVVAASALSIVIHLMVW